MVNKKINIKEEPVMDQFKKRLIRLWEKMVVFAKWCESHGIPKMLVETTLKLLCWWITHQ